MVRKASLNKIRKEFAKIPKKHPKYNPADAFIFNNDYI